MPGRSIGSISQRDAGVLRHVGIGAHEQLAEVADLAERAPDLLAGDHVVVAVADRPGAQRREVGARARLREALAPHLVAAEDLRQVLALLLVGALGHDRRARVEQPDEVHADVRRPGPGGLLEEDQLLARRQVAAAVLHRPVEPGVAGVEQPALPVGVPARGGRSSRRGPAAAAASAARPRATSRRSARNCLVGVGVAEIHAVAESTGRSDDPSDPGRESRMTGGGPSVGCGHGARGPGRRGGAGARGVRRGGRRGTARRDRADLSRLHRRRPGRARRLVLRLLDARPLRGHRPAEAAVRRARIREPGRVAARARRQPRTELRATPPETVWTWFPPDQSARLRHPPGRQRARDPPGRRAGRARSQEPVDAELAADGIEEIFVLLRHPQKDDLLSPTATRCTCTGRTSSRRSGSSTSAPTASP